MITADKINKVLDEAEAHTCAFKYEGSPILIYSLLGKALVYAVIYAAELIAKSIKNSS